MKLKLFGAATPVYLVSLADVASDVTHEKKIT